MVDYSDIKEKIFEQLALPYVYYAQKSVGQKAILASYALNMSKDILLISSVYIFSYSAIIAGLTQEHIEYIAKNAPKDYKIELLNTMLNDYRMKEVFEIAKMMDDDLGGNVTQNQNRVKSVQQYVLDNLVAFQF